VGTNLHAYGKTFLAEWPEETTDLFIVYYTGKYIPIKPGIEEAQKSTSPPPSITGALTSLRDAADITKYVQYLPYLSEKSKSSMASSQSSAKNIPAASRPTTSTPKPLETVTSIPQYQPPRPRAAFSIFVDYPLCFIRFLEAMMEDEGFSSREKKDVDDICTTLFEAYLHETKQGKEGQTMWEQKAKSLLTDWKVLLPLLETDRSYRLIPPCYFHILPPLEREQESFESERPYKSTFFDLIRARKTQKELLVHCMNTVPTSLSYIIWHLRTFVQILRS
jgi:hypothetical protein